LFCAHQGEYLYCVSRDVTREKKLEETLRCFLLTTRRARAHRMHRI
jgi:hypothetical protein